MQFKVGDVVRRNEDHLGFSDSLPPPIFKGDTGVIVEIISPTAAVVRFFKGITCENG